MATDRTESTRRGQSLAKTTTKHPFISIDHRIVDSLAFANLKPTAQVLILFIARQLKKDNNGHLQATFSWCKRYGIGSEHTLRDSIAQLITHGFLYRTRSHGANGAWATYALTWLPVTKKEGLFMAGLKPFAFRDWIPTEKKSTPQKVQEQSGRKCSFTPEVPAESAGTHPAKTADYESCCHVAVNSARSAPSMTAINQPGQQAVASSSYGAWIAPYVSRLAERGLAHACPVSIN